MITITTQVLLNDKRCCEENMTTRTIDNIIKKNLKKQTGKGRGGCFILIAVPKKVTNRVTWYAMNERNPNVG